MPAEDLLNDDDFAPQVETETAGPGGGRKCKTAIGAAEDGGDAGGGGWDVPPEMPGGAGRGEPIRHSHLKDIAIEVLSHSRSRDYSNLYLQLCLTLSDFDLAAEALADALSRIVISAYMTAQYSQAANVFGELRRTFPCLSENQLRKIIRLARTA